MAIDFDKVLSEFRKKHQNTQQKRNQKIKLLPLGRGRGLSAPDAGFIRVMGEFPGPRVKSDTFSRPLLLSTCWWFWRGPELEPGTVVDWFPWLCVPLPDNLGFLTPQQPAASLGSSGGTQRLFPILIQCLRSGMLQNPNPKENTQALIQMVS